MIEKQSVGIAGIGVYLPEQVMTAGELALRAGLPREVVEEKMGLRQKHVAGTNEHPSDMALAAAKIALAGHDPGALDAVIYFGSAYKDYPVWSAASRIQYELGAHRAFATEIMSLCVSATMALRLAKSLMQAEEGISNVLLVGGSKESTLLNYDNPRLRFMYNFGDGGAALLLKKGHAENAVLESHHITAGFFHKHVKVLAGGSAQPIAGSSFSKEDGLLEVIDPEEMKEHLDPISFDNFLSVVNTALAKSGLDASQLDFLAPVHFKRSMHKQVLAALKLSDQQSFYLEDFGHVQAADPIIGIYEASKRGLLKNGDHIALMAAGTGYTWGSTIVRWGKG